MSAMTGTLTVRIPGKIPRELSPNASIMTPAGMKNRLRGRMRHDWYYAIVGAMHEQGDASWAHRPYLWECPVRCRIVYYRPKGGKPLDGDNLLASLKAGLDQVQQAGVVPNDALLRFEPVRQDRDPDGVGYVEITLEPIDA